MSISISRHQIALLSPYLVLVTLVTLSLYIYQRSAIGFPRADHYLFLKERVFYSSDWDFFINMLSFSRTRHLAQGDSFLFRPGTTGLLAVIDIFLRSNLFVIGALSIIWHAFIAWTIFLIGRVLKSPLSGLILAVWFLVQYAGMEMILWRHISPYMFSLVSFGMGLTLLNRSALNLSDLPPKFRLPRQSG